MRLQIREQAQISVPKEDTVSVSFTDQLADQERYLDQLKAKLAEDLTNPSAVMNGEDIAKRAAAIAHCEGRIEVLYAISDAEQRNMDESVMREILMKQALRDPSDTWSGRGNDVARSKADGRRSMIDSALWDL